MKIECILGEASEVLDELTAKGLYECDGYDFYDVITDDDMYFEIDNIKIVIPELNAVIRSGMWYGLDSDSANDASLPPNYEIIDSVDLLYDINDQDPAHWLSFINGGFGYYNLLKQYAEVQGIDMEAPKNFRCFIEFDFDFTTEDT